MSSQPITSHQQTRKSSLWPRHRRQELQAAEEQLRAEYVELELLELTGQPLSSAQRTRHHQLISMARVCLSLSRFTRRHKSLNEFLQRVACQSGGHTTPLNLEISAELARELKLRWPAFGQLPTQNACPALDPDASNAGRKLQQPMNHDANPASSAQ